MPIIPSAIARRPTLAAAVLAALAVAACGKGAAEDAMLASDEAILRGRSDAVRFAPDALTPVLETAAAARAAYDRGDYRRARELALTVPGRAEAVRQAAAAAQADMTARWQQLLDTLPDRLTLVGDKLAALAGMRRPPTFITPEQTDTARTRLAQASESWSAALKAFNEGDLVEAVQRATSASTTADELATLLEPVVLPPG